MAKPKRLNAAEAIRAIAYLEEFKSHTGNFSAEWQGDVYVVLSYKQWIAYCDGTHWIMNPAKYTVTTSRHQAWTKRGATINGGLVR
jgi:hypothetical protein